MRIVLDTNILARARTGPFGPAGELLRLVLRDHHLIISPALITELSRVLRYARLRALHGASDAELDGYVRDLQQHALLVVPAEPLTPPAVISDPDDDAVIAAAFAGSATVICTRDRHLLNPAVRARCEELAFAFLLMWSCWPNFVAMDDRRKRS